MESSTKIIFISFELGSERVGTDKDGLTGAVSVTPVEPTKRRSDLGGWTLIRLTKEGTTGIQGGKCFGHTGESLGRGIEIEEPRVGSGLGLDVESESGNVVRDRLEGGK